MTTNTIKIFDPKEKPFGWLSNNYTHFMQIDGKEWRNVTSYAYANILTNAMSIQEVRLLKNVKDVKTTFHRLYQEEIDNVTKKAIETALEVKFENVNLAEKLLATGNSPIFYVSSNELLGTGSKNDGQNVYGQYLMQTRHMLRVSFRKKKEDEAKFEKDQNMYDIYLADIGLTKAIRDGNDLKEFMNKSPSEIIELIGRSGLEKLAPDRNTVLELIHKKYITNYLLDAMDNPEILVPMIRKNEIRKLRLRKIKERKEIIFDMYADYLLSKHFNEINREQYNKAKEQQFQQMSWNQKSDLENRLYDLFEKGMLSERLSNSIDERLAYHHIPSEEDVEEAEHIQINVENKSTFVDSAYVSEKGKPILVYPSDFAELDPEYREYVSFSPISLTGMLNISGKNFPTVSHYIIARLIAHIPTQKGGGGFGVIDKAYPQILVNPNGPVEGLQSFISPDLATIKYDNLRDENYRINLEKYAKKGLDKKFEDRIFQDILLMTGNAKLVYNDFSDNILGVGGRHDKKINFVGNYLMTLRNKFVYMRKDETLIQLHSEDISSIFNVDPFMKEWLNMRVKDMCKVLILVKNYLYAKDKIDNKLNPAFATAVLDKVYQPCSQIFGATNLITVEAPQYFRMMIRNYPGFNQVGNETIEVIWKRIAVIIYYLIKHIKESNIQNIRTILGRIELLVSKNVKCIDIVPDDYDNCIVSALLNLLRGLVEFNKQFSYNTDVTDRDVKTAASIILNADVSEININKPQDPELAKENESEDQEDQEGEGGQEGEEGEELVFPDDDDQEGEIDYGDEPGDDEFSPHKNMIISALREIDEVRDPEVIALAIENMLEIIKTYHMSKQVKRNRINFFATQRA